MSAAAPQTEVQGAGGSSLPTKFLRLVAERAGSSFREAVQVETTPIEAVQPGQGEVLIQVHYAGINGGCETFRARREFAFASSNSPQGPGQGPPTVLMGAEGAGLVAAVGPGVTKLKVGQPVAMNGGHAFAEYCIAPERSCTALQGSPTPQAVAVTLSGLTAAGALQGTAQVKAGDTVVVTAAAGGTGHFAVQIALAAGAHVIAVCGGATKVQALQGLKHEPGQLRVVDRLKEDLGSVLEQHYPKGVDIVYEGVGGAVRDALVKHLAPGGRLLQVGYISEYPHATGYAPPAHLQQQNQQQEQEQQQQQAGLLPCEELFWKGLEETLPEGRRIIGRIWPRDPMTLMRIKQNLFKSFYEGKLEAWVDPHALQAYQGVPAIPDAIDAMLQGGHIGKVVVRVAP
eukprot:CAMPEP_0202340696 /NCGR_PEP_ID=MMETSP1126-20121109/2022_1 /ASSEMBLY_ACC=CAM_ASM_000457 /TAXON_ID=3047 /ORGANISM="Dunaliella tertiolecta, Strain CCMP1320" /LENGTH=399 /DNA_ID=CAMNT_0048931433 /DNA_START=39 /DNA_END=1238 /DNA_ORIENTATION=-